MNIDTEIRIPDIWGDNSYKLDDCGTLNYLIGPNGTGKSLFGEKLKRSIRNYPVRYLSADRLSGMVETTGDHRFSNTRLNNGFDLQHEEEYSTKAKQLGYSSDSYMILNKKPDLKIRVQAILSEYFNRKLELKLQGGYLVPEVVDKNTSNHYNLRENESHGLKELISLLAIIHDDEHDILIIDEPELHLHPQYQKFLLQEIQKISGSPEKEGQKCFFLITHSPSMLDFRSIEDMTNVYSFRDKSRPPNNVSQFDKEDKYHIKNLIPRLNTQHKEVLFSKQPILVEGYTDEQIFSLAIEKHDKLAKDPGSTIIDVGGKGEVNSFFRFCQGLGFNPRLIADLDTLFEGNLRSTLSNLEKVKDKSQSGGVGSDLMDGISVVENELGDIIREIQDRPLNSSSYDIINNLETELNRIGDWKKKRYITYRAILSDEDAFQSEFNSDNIKLITGKLNTITSLLGECGYYILEKGELEDYLTDEEVPLTGVKGNKKDIFQKARTNLQNLKETENVSDIVGDLSPIVNDISNSKKVDVLSHMQKEISQWIHEVQQAVRDGEIQSIEQLRSHQTVGQERYDRMFEVNRLTVADSKFECEISIVESLDPDRSTTIFGDETIPSKITL